MMIPNIDVPSSKQFLKSVAEGTVALCLHDDYQVKLLMIDYIGEESPVVTPIITVSSKSLGKQVEFSGIEIISMMTETPQLRTLLVVLGTESHIITQYVHYDPSVNNPKLETLPLEWHNRASATGLNASLEYIRCEKAVVKKDKNSSTRVTSRCLVVVSNYLMKTLVYEAKISNWSLSGGNQVYSFSTPSSDFGDEYEIPRFFRVSSIRVSRDFIAVRVISTLDYHNQILVYKRGRREVWSSAYSSYETTVSYDLGVYKNTTNWLYINEFGTTLKVYKIGNMTMEVKEGYNATESLSLAYSTFGRPREVEAYRQDFKFLENLKRKDNTILFIFGSLGGSFGILILLWCYCCIFRCVYLWFVKRFDKREKKMVPRLVKKSK